jgi:hypothetical protein
VHVPDDHTGPAAFERGTPAVEAVLIIATSPAAPTGPGTC